MKAVTIVASWGKLTAYAGTGCSAGKCRQGAGSEAMLIKLFCQLEDCMDHGETGCIEFCRLVNAPAYRATGGSSDGMY